MIASQTNDSVAAANTRWRAIVVAGALALAGCAQRHAVAPDDAVKPAQAAGQTGDADRETAAPEPKTPPTPMGSVLMVGQVVSVHPTLRFVVLDFPIGKMPSLNQRLNLYRDGRKVAEVKVTGPARDTTIAGDIIAGEAQAGDEARQD